MKSEQEVRQRLRKLYSNKRMAKLKGFEQAYIINCKLIKLFKWVLDEEKVRKKRTYRGLKK